MMFRAIAPLLSAGALAGCAAQTILVSDTRSFVTAGHAAGDRAATALHVARERQLAANVLLVASDPSCQWGSYIYLRTDGTSGTSLCVNGPDAARSGTRYSLRPLGPEAAAPAAELIAAIGAYVGELSRLDDAHVPEFKQAVDDARARATRLQGVLGGLGALDPGTFGQAATALKAADSRFAAPADAVAGLLDFLAGLAKVEGQAKQIRQYVAEHGAAFEEAVDALVVVMDAWNVGVVGTSAQVARDSLVVGTNRVLAATTDFARRREILSQLVVALEEQKHAGEEFDRATRLLADLKAQHVALRAFAAGNYTAADRVRIARVQEEQTWELLGRVADLGKALGGAF